MSKLCTARQQLAVLAIASARRGGATPRRSTTTDVAELARRFGMSSAEADAWARGPWAALVLEWPANVFELIEPVGLFEEIGLDETVAVLDRLAQMMPEPSSPPVVAGAATADQRQRALVGVA